MSLRFYGGQTAFIKSVQALSSLMKQMQINRRTVIRVCRNLLTGLAVCACLALTACRTATRTDSFSFVAAGDMRNFANGASVGKRYFDGACEAMQRLGPGNFMITPGDFDPPAAVRATIDRYLGTNYLWYPVVGNHEIETPEDMAWVREWAAQIPNLVRRGPPGAELTTYSFDFGNSHFAMINDYFDGHLDAVAKGRIGESTLAWLEKDLAATRKPLIWVVGHQPIESLPDMDSQRMRHQGETVSTNVAAAARFVQLLEQHHVRAYICGHTHNASVAKVKGVWQADSGAARGAGDKGSPSTFLKFRVAGTETWVDVYRADPNGENYQLRKTVQLDCGAVSTTERPKQHLHLLIHLRGVGERLRDLVAEQLPVALAQAMHGRTHRAFIHAQRFCGVGVRHRAFARGEKKFELLELFALAGRHAFIAQPDDDPLQQRQRPFAVKRLVRTQLGGGGDLKLRVRRCPIQR